MSIKLMSAIFATKFMDLKDAAGNVTKTNTAKLVLLALADHARDDGGGAYPSLKTMARKTALTRQCIIKTYRTLKYNGIIAYQGVSELGTNIYTINTEAFPKTIDASQSRLLVNPVDRNSQSGLPPQVNPVDQGSQPDLPPPVNPVDQGGKPGLPQQVNPDYPNHPLTTIKPSKEDEEERTKILKELEGLSGAFAPDTTRLIDTWLEKHPLERIQQANRVARDRGARSPKYIDQDGKATLPVKPPDQSSHCTNDSPAALPVQPLHQSSHCTIDGPATLPVQPLHQSSHCTIDSPATLPSSVQPLDLNRPLTILKPPDEDDEQRTKVLRESGGLSDAVPPATSRLIDTWLEKHPPGRILEAIRVARNKRARSPKYADQVLIGWEANGYPPTREQQILARAFKPAKGGNGKGPARDKIPDYSEAGLTLAAKINRTSALRKAALAEARPAGIPP